MKKTLRIFICLAAGAALLCLILPKASGHIEELDTEPQPEPLVLNEVLINEMSDIEGLEGLDASMKSYLRKWDIHGGSLAITRNDSLVYAKGYGDADDDGTPVQPSTIFRLASVSKLITAVGIMILEERGLLSLYDKVFTPQGILGDEPYTGVITDRRYFDITVEDLLRHTAGFSTGAGDPMFNTRDLMRQNHWTTPPDSETLSKYYLSRRLGFAPGQGNSYSNYGYLLLSMIIEKITGEQYEQWMQENVLHPAGCRDIHIGQNYYDLKYPNETRYYPVSNEGPIECYDNSGNMVERCYGGNNIPALLGAGAWVGSAPELALFIAAIDGDDRIPDILSKESIEKMTLPTDKETFGIGWIDTKDTGEWTRTGTFSGTTALIKHYPDGECWILLTNTSTFRGPRFSNYTAEQFEKSREKYSSLLPSRNMFFAE